MPDGDFIHPTLEKRFEGIYKQVCEGHWEPDYLGTQMLRPLKAQIRSYGNAPIIMGQQIVTMLTTPDFSPNDIRKNLETLGKEPFMNIKPRGRDMMVEAANRMLVQIESGEIVENMEYTLYRTYVDIVYVRDCESRIPQTGETGEHYQGISHQEVRERFNAVRPSVECGLDAFARQIVQHKSINKLRRPSNLKKIRPTISELAW